MKKYLLAIPVLAFALTGCGLGSNTGNDAGTERVAGKRHTYNMADGWSNIALVCVYGVPVLETDQGSTTQMLLSLAGTKAEAACNGRDGDPSLNR